MTLAVKAPQSTLPQPPLLERGTVFNIVKSSSRIMKIISAK